MERVAVIVIHGVADQVRGATSEALAELLIAQAPVAVWSPPHWSPPSSQFYLPGVSTNRCQPIGDALGGSGPTDAGTVVLAQVCHGFTSHRARPHFFAATSLNIALFRRSSATSRLSRAFLSCDMLEFARLVELDPGIRLLQAVVRVLRYAQLAGHVRDRHDQFHPLNHPEIGILLWKLD